MKVEQRIVHAERRKEVARVTPLLAVLLHRAVNEHERQELVEAFADYETEGVGGWCLVAA